MRTTLNISSDLLKEVVRLYEKKTTSKAVEEALKDALRRKRAESLLSLAGKIEIEDLTRELEDAELKEARGSID